jgi:hypothetical protein
LEILGDLHNYLRNNLANNPYRTTDTRFALKRVFESKYTKIDAFGKKIPHSAILKEGDPTQWGYKHIFEYIRPEDTTTRAEQIIQAFPDVNNNDDIITKMIDVLKNGENHEVNKYRKLYDIEGGNKRYFEVWFRDGTGSISSAIPKDYP